MGYMTNGLTFNTLRGGNLARVTEFKDAKGRLSHRDGVHSWTPAEWLMAACGELGELANLLKKIHRGDFTTESKKQEFADELADTVTYLDLLAARLDIDLGKAVINKFNAVSMRVGSNIHIDEEDWHRL